ncbi:MAG: hypothetical protein IPF98_15785 [Gemmatimonadetes bacterium]|nr:hypothetical protein [Gemmatimonadota bacterium]
MRRALLATIGLTLILAAPATGQSQRRDDGSLRDRVRGVLQDRDDADRSRRRDGRWDWERGRDNDRDNNRNNDRNSRDNRGYGYSYDRNADWKAYEREQRDFDRRARRWNSRQWNAFRSCERDLLRRARWDRNDSRREELRERRRIRDYCERRVSRW